MQSGVSLLMLSSNRDFVIICVEFCVSSLRMAYSVRVSLISLVLMVTMCVSVLNVISSKVRMEAAETAATFRSYTAILAKSSFILNGFVT